MLGTIREEFRKLLTVRSTYYILLIGLAAEGLFAWWVGGWRLAKSNPAALHDPAYLSSQVTSAINTLSLLFAISAVLLVAHEYRYNTIMYTLISAKNRTSVFLAKLLTVSVYALVCAAVFGALAPLLSQLGASMHHTHLVAQHIDYFSVAWRSLLATWGFVVLAAIIAFIVRNQVGSFAALFLLPAMIEPLLTLLLRDNNVYLPFHAINELLDMGAKGKISYGHAALVSLAWVVGSGLVAWVLFNKRDAN